PQTPTPFPYTTLFRSNFNRSVPMRSMISSPYWRVGEPQQAAVKESTRTIEENRFTPMTTSPLHESGLHPVIPSPPKEGRRGFLRSEEHTSELQSRENL